MVLAAQDLGWRARGRSIVAGVTLRVRAGEVSGRIPCTGAPECVTLRVRAGEVLGVIGPNGSGKSTLLRLLAGLLKPATGRVDLMGQNMAGMGARQVARIMAFVAQSADTTDRITVQDAVELGRTPWLDAWHPWSDADSAHVGAALSRVEMTGFEGRDWITLSGGERQRAHIARALAQTPQIMLLDEPTNHLDIHHQLSILRLIAQLRLTTVIALHDLNQAMTCDRLAVMHQGRLIALDTPGRVLTPELLHDVFAVRATELTDPADGKRVLRFHSV